MIPVLIETLVVNPKESASVIILRPFGESKTSGRILPIYIGPNEAISIGMALENIPRPRPITHDLIIDIFSELNINLKYISIVKVDGTTFYAELHIEQNDKTYIVDARPSDAMALAVRTGAPIFVSSEVMDRASYPYILGKQVYDEAQIIEDFHDFVQNLEPSDFSSK